jgi:hypothetical protein
VCRARVWVHACVSHTPNVCVDRAVHAAPQRRYGRWRLDVDSYHLICLLYCGGARYDARVDHHLDFGLVGRSRPVREAWAVAAVVVVVSLQLHLRLQRQRDSACELLPASHGALADVTVLRCAPGCVRAAGHRRRVVLLSRGEVVLSDILGVQRHHLHDLGVDGSECVPCRQLSVLDVDPSGSPRPRLCGLSQWIHHRLH